MVQKVLDTLCEQVEGCATLAFVDLSTRMVLITNSGTPESQETLNALSVEADILLQSGTTALSGTSGEMHVFLRADNEPSDVMCCICGLGTDVAQLLPAAQDCLNAISNGDAADE
jgi:hypothetical protein